MRGERWRCARPMARRNGRSASASGWFISMGTRRKSNCEFRAPSPLKAHRGAVLKTRAWLETSRQKGPLRVAHASPEPTSSIALLGIESVRAARAPRGSRRSENISAQVLIFDNIGELLAHIVSIYFNSLFFQIRPFERHFLQQFFHDRVQTPGADIL